jgi:hypothetical protein
MTQDAIAARFTVVADGMSRLPGRRRRAFSADTASNQTGWRAVTKETRGNGEKAVKFDGGGRDGASYTEGEAFAGRSHP